ncbi:DNA repair protein RecN [Pedobacter chitinilyticus]|uniref:DNA repair protein RecN n=1 Tax=Pedobacter chitinilyticus TaxID=2233776 RepID=A0A443YW79_9SPHI|nr:DNA repair protein RecN [Pedobacter chitinilyticus]RWU08261.1 DNA repair protein RecN [Pedobacter chitinilyticus]
MLQKLSIRNYALIDTLEIDFDRGLNIITGETGAGKSIILGALSLILGQRAESKYFFNQDKKCVIEGSFFLADEQLKSLFENNDVDFQQETTLRREIAIDGKSRAFVNDTPVNLATLKLIGENLIAIHSQHATLEISNADFQLLILDVLANHQSLLKSYKEGFRQLRQTEKQLALLTEQTEEAKKKQDYEQFLFNELEEAALKEDEQEHLEQELEKLTHAESIKRSLIASANLISESETAAINLVKEAGLQLNSIEKFDPAIAEINERLKSTLIELRDIASEISGIEENTEHNAARMETIQERLDLFYALQQKHRVGSNAELLAIQEQLSQNLNALLNSDEQLEKLQQEIDALNKDLRQQAKELDGNRRKAMVIAEKEVGAALKQMNMPNASISFNLTEQAQLNNNGMNEVQLLFTANAGQQAAPVGKVASGGELSRLMLAIKALLAKHTALSTLIFDEIDTGISGETALRVGEVIDALAQNMQILAITHLPQIASKGNSHYFVYKHEKADKTTTGIKKLDTEERVNAIAEMLSGKNPGASALQNAKELLNVS